MRTLFSWYKAGHATQEIYQTTKMATISLLPCMKLTGELIGRIKLIMASAYLDAPQTNGAETISRCQTSSLTQPSHQPPSLLIRRLSVVNRGTDYISNLCLIFLGDDEYQWSYSAASELIKLAYSQRSPRIERPDRRSIANLQWRLRR